MASPPLPSALGQFDEIYAEGAGKRLALFLDYDGTLSPIAERPEDAHLEPGMLDVLRSLVGRVDVAVVSGRGLADVRDRIRLERIAYAGSHGFEMEDAAGHLVQLEEADGYLPALGFAETELRSRLATYEGVLIERKRFTIAVHYRLTPERTVPQVEQVVDQVVALAPGLITFGGKMVFEIRPELDWNKGKAVQYLARGMGAADALFPIYIGDDVTDEDAFRAVIGWGMGIFVGPADRVTNARYALRDTGEVRLFLTRLLARLQDRNETKGKRNGD